MRDDIFFVTAIVVAMAASFFSSLWFHTQDLSKQWHPSQHVIWSPPQNAQHIVINGQDKGCIVQGIDDQGFDRWTSVQCQDKTRPLTKQKTQTKIKP